MMERVVFAFLAAPGKLEDQALVLAESIRTFAGDFSQSPIWVLIPESTLLSEDCGDKLGSLNARLISFEIDSSERGFPFAGKVVASSRAEAMARDQTEYLVWMDTHSLLLNEPRKIFLNPGKILGYRPVDHTLIGSRYEQPLDPFWERIYQDCQVPEEKIFPMTASVDEIRLRPYFNAGFLVVRPERGLLQMWCENFKKLYQEPSYEHYYDQDDLYRIFMHQAILAGTVLSFLEQRELQELSYLVNYPLHMHEQYPDDLRPMFLNELITCRYETTFEDPGWEEVIRVNEPLRGWLVDIFGGKAKP
jgi:hypothetical protein